MDKLYDEEYHRLVGLLEDITNLILNEYEKNIENTNPVKQMYVKAMNAVYQFNQSQKEHKMLVEWIYRKLDQIINKKLQKYDMMINQVDNEIQFLEEVNKDFKFLEVFLVFFCSRVYDHMDDGIHIVQDKILTKCYCYIRDKFFNTVAVKLGHCVVSVYQKMQEEKIGYKDQILLKQIRYSIVCLQQMGFNEKNIDQIELTPNTSTLIKVIVKQKKGKQIFFGMDEDQYKYYKKYIEDSILDHQKSFYKKKINENWRDKSMIEYIDEGLKALDFENVIIQNNYPESQINLQNNLYQIIITETSDNVLQKDTGLYKQFQEIKDIKLVLENKVFLEKNISIIKKVYQFYNKVKILVPKIAAIFSQYILHQGEYINQTYQSQQKQLQEQTQKGEKPNPTKEEICKGSVLSAKQLFEYTNSIMEQSFSKDEVIQQQCNNAFTKIINNQGQSKATSIYITSLPYYLDQLCSSQSQEMDNNQIEKLINKIIFFLTDRDLFVEYYKRLLSHRLLQNKSKNLDLESQIVSYLTTELSLAKMKNVQTMLNDYIDSKNITEIYRKSYSRPKPNFTLTILNSCSWPELGVQNDQTMLMFEISQLSEYIQSKYKNSFPGRCLKFIPSQGTCELVFIPNLSNPSYKRSMNVNIYCGIILLQIQKCQNQVCYQYQLQELTKIPNQQFNDNLNYLVKQKIIQITDDSKILINQNYTNRNMKFNLINTRQIIQEQKIDQETQEQRKIQVQATLVRIMKSHRTNVSYNTLISECQALISKCFLPQPKEIKQQIDSLIDRAYMKRQENNNQLYDYIP